MSNTKESMIALEQDPIAAQDVRRSERWRYWRVYRWLLLALICAGLLIVMGCFGPGDPLNTVTLWTGIIGLFWVLLQGAHTAISMWSYRRGCNFILRRWEITAAQIAVIRSRCRISGNGAGRRAGVSG